MRPQRGARLSPLNPWGPAQGLHTTEDVQETFGGCWQAGKVDLLVEEAPDEAGPFILSHEGTLQYVEHRLRCWEHWVLVPALSQIRMSLFLTGPVFSYMG